MTKEEIQALYKLKILPESKDPYHFSKSEDAQHIVPSYNPMCGDKYSLFVRESDKLDAVHFHGFGCAISKASTSIMIKRIEGLGLNEAKNVCVDFLKCFDEENTVLLDEELKILVELKNFGGRLDCIQLSWKAILNHLSSEIES